MLQEFLGIIIDRKVGILKLLNNEPSIGLSTAKEVRFDMQLEELGTGCLFNVEMQTSKQVGYKKRAIYYASKMLSSILPAKGVYKSIPNVYSVNLLLPNLFPDQSAHIKESLGCLNMSYIQLARLEEIDNLTLQDWLRVFTIKEEKGVDDMLARVERTNNSEIVRLLRQLKKINSNQEVKAKLLSEEKAKYDALAEVQAKEIQVAIKVLQSVGKLSNIEIAKSLDITLEELKMLTED